MKKYLYTCNNMGMGCKKVKKKNNGRYFLLSLEVLPRKDNLFMTFFIFKSPNKTVNKSQSR